MKHTAIRSLILCSLVGGNALFDSTADALAAAAAWTDYASQPDDWYRSADGLRVTTNILSWQSSYGSWPKNTNTTALPFPGDPKDISGTFDNGATTDELRFLARAFRITQNPRCEQAFLKGVDHIFIAQYPTGGWPQYYPLSTQYHRHITFNDNSMIRVMQFLREIATSPGYAFVDAARRKAAQDSFDRGVQCILKCQIVLNGKPTVWCAQHDEMDYSPRVGRSYELVSLSGSESVGILELFMSLDNPKPDVARAIKSAAEWFETAKLTGIRVVQTNGDRVVVQDPTAPPLWARFYDIESNRPFFSGRDGVKKSSLAEIERERRGGYAWYGNWGARVAGDYAAWKAKWPAQAGAN